MTSALCALIPVPLLDDHFLRRTRRRMVREAAAEVGLTLDEAQVQHLSGTEPGTAFGCLIGAFIAGLLKIVFWIVRRFFRTVLFFLAAKDAADQASRTLHEGFLLRSAMPDLAARLETLRQAGGERVTGSVSPEIRRVRRAIEETCREVDPRPIERVIKRSFRGSLHLLRRASRLFARQARRAERGDGEITSETGPDLAPEVTDRMASALAGERSYFEHLESVFRSHLEPDIAEGPSRA